VQLLDEQDAVGETGQRVVPRLVQQLRLDGPFVRLVAGDDDEVRAATFGDVHGRHRVAEKAFVVDPFLEADGLTFAQRAGVVREMTGRTFAVEVVGDVGPERVMVGETDFRAPGAVRERPVEP
jgi:hypothetical protein